MLEALIMATGVGCLVASHTWQSRLCWSFARDGGVPFSRFFSRVDERLDVPLRAHGLSSAIVAALGCLYLGSYTAFNRYDPPAAPSSLIKIVSIEKRGCC